MSRYRTNKGKRNWKKLDTKTMKFHIFDDQLASYQEVEEVVKSLKNDIEEWKETFTSLEEEKRKLVKQVCDTINSMADEIRTLKETNNQLENYIKCLEKEEGKQRTLKTFMSRAETAFWFAKAFGLELESMKLKEVKTGKSHVIETNMNSTSSDNIDKNDDDMSKLRKLCTFLISFVPVRNFTTNFP